MNHHDETRKMLELIREDRRKVVPTQRLLTEQDINVQEEKELDPSPKVALLFPSAATIGSL